MTSRGKLQRLVLLSTLVYLSSFFSLTLPDAYGRAPDERDKIVALVDASSTSPDEPVCVPKDPKPGERLTITIQGVEMNFRWAPPGSFVRKDKASESHKVRITKGFWIAETETTQAQWCAASFENPSKFKGNAALPVEQASWKDCQSYIRRLNDERPNELSGFKFALPTEAQWEYACRAGTSAPFNFGSTLNGDRANCNGTLPYGFCPPGRNLGETCVVKSYKPNSWGLYDMHGNVSEWCDDWYDPDYYKQDDANLDPTGPKSGERRVMRGGSWRGSADMCLSELRSCADPESKNDSYGFRLVLTSAEVIKRVVSPASALGQVATNDQEGAGDGADPDSPKPGELKTATINGVELNFRWAPPGSFIMGAPESETPNSVSSERLREITIDKGFWIAETEVTQELWEAVAGNNPSERKGDKQLPVDSVTWEDCYNFIWKLNDERSGELTGFEFAFPTEKQWEYACRAGSTEPFSFGAFLNGVAANCDGNFPFGTTDKGPYLGKPAPVKSYAPNPWGLYDMHGNVCEWCSDYYAPNYKRNDQDYNTRRLAYTARVLRGGSWRHHAQACRSAARMGVDSTTKSSLVGLRLVLLPL